MACVTESIGMSLPGCATALAITGEKRRSLLLAANALWEW